jgi:ABC-type multidrug transport system permease subunit
MARLRELIDLSPRAWLDPMTLGIWLAGLVPVGYLAYVIVAAWLGADIWVPGAPDSPNEAIPPERE